MPRGVKRSELEVIEAEIKKLDAKIETAQTTLKKDKAARSKLFIKRESLMAHDLIQHAKKNSLSMDDVKAMMENAGNKAAAVAKGAIQKAEDALEAVDKKIPDVQPADEKPASPAPAGKKTPAKKATAKKTAPKKAAPKKAAAKKETAAPTT